MERFGWVCPHSRFRQTEGSSLLLRQVRDQAVWGLGAERQSSRVQRVSASFGAHWLDEAASAEIRKDSGSKKVAATAHPPGAISTAATRAEVRAIAPPADDRRSVQIGSDSRPRKVPRILSARARQMTKLIRRLAKLDSELQAQRASSGARGDMLGDDDMTEETAYGLMRSKMRKAKTKPCIC